MKLRIRGNSIRLRLTQTEVVTLAEQGLVEEKTDFGHEKLFVYAVAISTKFETVTADFQNNRINIFIPQTIAETWANGEVVGISGEQDTLKLLIEKDFNCLIKRNTEDDSDTFPHPKEI